MNSISFGFTLKSAEKVVYMNVMSRCGYWFTVRDTRTGLKEVEKGKKHVKDIIFCGYFLQEIDINT